MICNRCGKEIRQGEFMNYSISGGSGGIQRTRFSHAKCPDDGIAGLQQKVQEYEQEIERLKEQATCGCGLCLAHIYMKCPKLSPVEVHKLGEETVREFDKKWSEYVDD